MTKAASPNLEATAASLSLSELDQEQQALITNSRRRLHSKLQSHADALASSLKEVDDRHGEAVRQFAQWIAANHRPGKPLDVIVICTGNSRRSSLGAFMGNLAASYCGMPDVRFHSGGTSPSAFNERTIAALREIGFAIEATGTEAPRGEAGTPNPVYRVRWGEGLEATEFSKHFADPINPQSGFAAIMVCNEADEGCPIVPGASVRISMPFSDPKSYDDSAEETQKYQERRDEIGRVMLAAMMQAQRGIAQKR